MRLASVFRLAAFALLVQLTSAESAAGQSQFQEGLPGAARASSGAQRPVLQASRITGGIRIDGRLDEPAWAEASAATGFSQFQPNVGPPASQRTEAYVLYDDEAVYVGARLYDTAPDSVVARLVRRDQLSYSDWFLVSFDSYDDNRTAFTFAVNPRGVKADLLFFEDVRQDMDWDAVWEADARVDSLGWVAEMRIPLSQLRFRPSEGGPLAWGLNFMRVIARYGEQSAWAPIDPSEGRIVSRFGRLEGLRALSPRRNLELLPYSVGRLTRAPGDPASPFYQANDAYLTAGADVKYGLTPYLTLNATINPDFGQVEADPSEVNLSAFESFFAERRPFFMEGADLFNIRGPNLFYSRRIGRQPQASSPPDAVFADVPAQTTILGAAKLTGQTANGWSLGALNATTSQEQARFVDTTGVIQTLPVEPTTNYTVLRARRNIGAGQSSLGGLLTATYRPAPPQRLDFLHAEAVAGGIDLRHRFAGDTYEVRGTLLGSHVRGSEAAIARTQRSSARFFQRPDARHVDLDPARTTLAGWSADVDLRQISGTWQWGVAGEARSPGFEVNDLGFLRSVDEVEASAFLSYQQFGQGRTFRRLSAYLSTDADWTFGGERTGTGLSLSTNGQFLNYWSFSARANASLPALSTTRLRGGPALQMDARSGFSGGFSSDERRPLRVSLSGMFGNNFGTEGLIYTLSPGLYYRPSPGLELSLNPRFSFDRTDDQYVARRAVGEEPAYVFGRLDQQTVSLTTRVNYSFTPDLSLQLYAQPFLSAGRYSRFRTVADPRARAFQDRFEDLGDRLSLDGDRYRVDADGDGVADYTFGRPDFNFRQFRSTLVTRWEYRPGSALFLVWSRGQTDLTPTGRLALGDDLGGLFAAPATDVFLLKLSYWFGL